MRPTTPHVPAATETPRWRATLRRAAATAVLACLAVIVYEWATDVHNAPPPPTAITRLVMVVTIPLAVAVLADAIVGHCAAVAGHARRAELEQIRDQIRDLAAAVAALHEAVDTAEQAARARHAHREHLAGALAESLGDHLGQLRRAMGDYGAGEFLRGAQSVLEEVGGGPGSGVVPINGRRATAQRESPGT